MFWRLILQGHLYDFTVSGMPCDYQEHRNTKLTITPDSAQSEVLNTSQTVCSRLCASRIRHHLECWALTYNKDRGECTLYYLRDPFFLTKTETTKDRHCITMTKECFHCKYILNASTHLNIYSKLEFYRFNAYFNRLQIRNSTDVFKIP